MEKIKFYNKLVRDKIPAIIESKGAKCTTVIVSQNTYLDLLDMKLCEELTEFRTDHSQEELADMLEVMMTVAKARGYDWNQILEIQAKKREERGGFDDRIVLISTEE